MDAFQTPERAAHPLVDMTTISLKLLNIDADEFAWPTFVLIVSPGTQLGDCITIPLLGIVLIEWKSIASPGPQLTNCVVVGAVGLVKCGDKLCTCWGETSGVCHGRRPMDVVGVRGTMSPDADDYGERESPGTGGLPMMTMPLDTSA